MLSKLFPVPAASAPAVTLRVTKLAGGTPVFACAGSPKLLQVYGATRVSPEDPLMYFPAFYPVYNLVFKDLQALKIQYNLSGAAQEVVARLDSYPERIKKKELPPNFQFRTKPYEHQLDGLIHLLYNYRAALFYACGLGKTKVIVDWQRATGCWPLIVCPKIVLAVWGKEVLRHGIEQEFALIDATTKKQKFTQLEDAKNYKGVVVTYDTLRLYAEEVAKLPYNAAVADESHCIKNYRSGRTEAYLDLVRKAGRRVIMSGTPTLGDPRDLFPQLKSLSSCFMPENAWKFKERFCVTSPYNKRIVTGFKNLDVLQERVTLIGIKRTQEQCLDLPPQHIVDIPVELSAEQTKAYNALAISKEYDDFVESMLKDVGLYENDATLSLPNQGVLISKLLQVTCGFMFQQEEGEKICDACPHAWDCVQKKIKPFTAACQVDTRPRKRLVSYFSQNAKRDVLLEKLDEILQEPTNKVIIWGQFTPELDLIEKAVEEAWPVKDYPGLLVRVDGKSGHAAEAEEKFNNDPKCRIYLGQVSTGVGITLNAANYMIYYSLPWSLKDWGQSKERNHRIGQTRQHTLFRLLAEGTVDPHIARALSTKHKVGEIVTTAIVCSRCERSFICMSEGIEVFDKKCKYQRSVSRPVTHVSTIRHKEAP